MERETGIEPVSLAWKAKVLPLNYSRPGSQQHLASTDKSWWRRLDSNQRTLCGQIYSLLPLTTRPPLLRQARNYSTGQMGRNRASPRRTKEEGLGSPRRGHAAGRRFHCRALHMGPPLRAAVSTPQTLAEQRAATVDQASGQATNSGPDPGHSRTSRTSCRNQVGSARKPFVAEAQQFQTHDETNPIPINARKPHL